MAFVSTSSLQLHAHYVVMQQMDANMHQANLKVGHSQFQLYRHDPEHTQMVKCFASFVMTILKQLSVVSHNEKEDIEHDQLNSSCTKALSAAEAAATRATGATTQAHMINSSVCGIGWLLAANPSTNGCRYGQQLVPQSADNCEMPCSAFLPFSCASCATTESAMLLSHMACLWRKDNTRLTSHHIFCNLHARY